MSKDNGGSYGGGSYGGKIAKGTQHEVVPPLAARFRGSASPLICESDRRPVKVIIPLTVKVTFF